MSQSELDNSPYVKNAIDEEEHMPKRKNNVKIFLEFEKIKNITGTFNRKYTVQCTIFMDNGNF